MVKFAELFIDEVVIELRVTTHVIFIAVVRDSTRIYSGLTVTGRM